MKKAIATTAALFLASCGQPTSNVDYHVNGGQTVTINDRKDGSVTAEIGDFATMPTDLPVWAPAYPGSKVLMVQNQSPKTSGGPLESVMLQTPDSLTKVTAFYDAKIAQAGLKPMHSVSSGEASIRLVQTLSGAISVNASKADDGGSTISISRMPKS